MGPIPFTRWTERVAAPSALKSIAPFVHLPILNLPFLSYTEGPLSHPLSHRVTVFALDSSGTRTDSHSSGAHTSTCSPPLTLPSLSYRFSSLSSALSTHFPTPPPSIFPSTPPSLSPHAPPSVPLRALLPPLTWPRARAHARGRLPRAYRDPERAVVAMVGRRVTVRRTLRRTRKWILDGAGGGGLRGGKGTHRWRKTRS